MSCWFEYEELQGDTGNFSAAQKLDEGRFGSVYKGTGSSDARPSDVSHYHADPTWSRAHPAVARVAVAHVRGTNVRGASSVYKGFVCAPDGKRDRVAVAIKRLNQRRLQADAETEERVKVLSKKHYNGHAFIK